MSVMFKESLSYFDDPKLTALETVLANEGLMWFIVKRNLWNIPHLDTHLCNDVAKEVAELLRKIVTDEDYLKSLLVQAESADFSLY